MNKIEEKLKRVGKSCFIDFFPFFLDQNYHFDKEKKVVDLMKLIQNKNPQYTNKSCETRAYTIRSLLEDSLKDTLSNIISSNKLEKSVKAKAQQHLDAHLQGLSIPSNLRITSHKEIKHQNFYPDEMSEPESFPEGAKKTIFVNAYERNTKARAKCIEHYGVNCSVCNFNFQDKFGDIGKGFIHVHHLAQLKDIKEEYEVDPIEHLRPVCPNCHAMLHKKDPPHTIDELKQKLAK